MYVITIYEHDFVNNVLKLYDCFRLDDLDIKLAHDALKELVASIQRDSKGRKQG